MPAGHGTRNEYRDFFVVFAPTSVRGFWSPFCKKEFGHCWAFWPHYVGQPGLMTPRNTMKIEAQCSNIDTDVWYAEPYEVAAEFLPIVTDILHLTLPFKTSFRYTPRGIITCVSIVKAVMDINAWAVWTPEQLYRHLLKLGAIRLKEGKEDGIRRYPIIPSQRQA